MKTQITGRRLAATLVSVGLVAAACGGDDEAADTTVAAPATTAAATATTAGEGSVAPTTAGETEGTEAPGTTDAEAPAVECPEPLAEPVSLKWGLRGGSTMAHVFVADSFGYFADENISVEYVAIGSPSDALPLLASGELDMANTGMTVGILNAIGRGLEVKMIAAQGQYAEDAPAPAGIYVRTDLIEDGTVTEVADLKGMKLGIQGGSNDLGNAGAYLVALFLAEGGLTLKDVEIVNVATADNPTAFETKAIDFTFLPGTVAPIVEGDDLARPFGDPNVLALKAQGGLMVGDKLLEEQRDVAKAVLRAMFRGAAEVQGDYREREDVIEALLASGNFDEATVRTNPYYYIPADLEILPEQIEEFQQVFLDYGGLIESGELLTFDQIVDDEIRVEAYQEFLACYPG